MIVGHRTSSGSWACLRTRWWPYANRRIYPHPPPPSISLKQSQIPLRLNRPHSVPQYLSTSLLPCLRRSKPPRKRKNISHNLYLPPTLSITAGGSVPANLSMTSCSTSLIIRSTRNAVLIVGQTILPSCNLSLMERLLVKHNPLRDNNRPSFDRWLRAYLLFSTYPLAHAQVNIMSFPLSPLPRLSPYALLDLCQDCQDPLRMLAVISHILLIAPRSPTPLPL